MCWKLLQSLKIDQSAEKTFKRGSLIQEKVYGRIKWFIQKIIWNRLDHNFTKVNREIQSL